MEHELKGGNVAANAVRIGETVRKPVTDATPSVEAFLVHLAKANFQHAPRSLGRDDQGRYILEFIEGDSIGKPESLTPQDLQQISAIIRQLHQLSANFPILASQSWSVAIQPDREELICHNDLGPWNLIRSKDRWVFIDWDGTGPASRLWDLAYAAQSFVPLIHGGDPAHDAVRLRAFLDGYRLQEHERSSFPQLLYQRALAMYRLLEDGARRDIQPWARMFQTGHGSHWRRAAQYIRKHRRVWSSVV